MPNIELTTIQRFMKQLSVDRNAPLPPRSRIPIKTLVVAEILLLVFIASDFHNHVDSCLSAAAYVVFVLCVCAIPVVIALIGMQLIHVPLWVLLVVGGIGVLSGMFVFGSYRVSVEMHVERRVRPDDSDTSPTKHVRNSVEREPED
ncbi:hypothetical protein BLNAU_11778 [Blattamonas nauphoetae]|nr:hypothetical protein BLNAU_11778 [Blattamonas nauphoetae]